MTTNLALADPESAGSISQNLQISSETSRPLTTTAGTNEVALWALQLYIVPFPNFQDQFQELRASIFRSIFSHGIRIPPPTQSHSLGHHPSSAPGEHFSHITPRYACSCSKLSNNCYMFFIFRYCSRRVFIFYVCRYLVITHST
jgi:hypothetical protein